MIFIALAGVRAWAQQEGVQGSAINRRVAASVAETNFFSAPSYDAQLRAREIPLGKKLHVRGPLVHVFKGRRVLEAPRRVWHLANPFAPAEHVEEFERTAELSPRAWATVAGMNPAGSAFPDATTHESSMGLISVGR